MWKLGRNWDTGGTPDKGRETLVEWRRGLTEGDGRGEEDLRETPQWTWCTYTNLSKPITVLSTGRKGGERNRAGTGGGFRKYCVHVCLYHPEFQQNVWLQCTNKNTRIKICQFFISLTTMLDFQNNYVYSIESGHVFCTLFPLPSLQPGNPGLFLFSVPFFFFFWCVGGGTGD